MSKTFHKDIEKKIRNPNALSAKMRKSGSMRHRNDRRMLEIDFELDEEINFVSLEPDEEV